MVRDKTNRGLPRASRYSEVGNTGRTQAEICQGCYAVLSLAWLRNIGRGGDIHSHGIHSPLHRQKQWPDTRTDVGHSTICTAPTTAVRVSLCNIYRGRGQRCPHPTISTGPDCNTFPVTLGTAIGTGFHKDDGVVHRGHGPRRPRRLNKICECSTVPSSP